MLCVQYPIGNSCTLTVFPLFYDDNDTLICFLNVHGRLLLMDVSITCRLCYCNMFILVRLSLEKRFHFRIVNPAVWLNFFQRASLTIIGKQLFVGLVNRIIIQSVTIPYLRKQFFKFYSKIDKLFVIKAIG